MKRHRHTPEQAVRKLREGERMLNEGKDLTEVLRLDLKEIRGEGDIWIVEAIQSFEKEGDSRSV